MLLVGRLRGVVLMVGWGWGRHLHGNGELGGGQLRGLDGQVEGGGRHSGRRGVNGAVTGVIVARLQLLLDGWAEIIGRDDLRGDALVACVIRCFALPCFAVLCYAVDAP